MRVLLAGIVHETNTFAEKRTDIDEFEANGFFRGEELFEAGGNEHGDRRGGRSGARSWVSI